MDITTMIIVFIIGCCVGYLANSLLTANRYEEDCSRAFERGKKFERMRITQTLENQKNNDA